jgi:hypothetical protein
MFGMRLELATQSIGVGSEAAMTDEQSSEQVAEPEKASDVDLPPDSESVASLPTKSAIN